MGDFSPGQLAMGGSRRGAPSVDIMIIMRSRSAPSVSDQQLALESESDLTQNDVRPMSVLRGGGEGRGGEERGASKAKRATKLPDGWTIPDAWTDWAVGFALDQGHHVARVAVLRVADRFRDWTSSEGITSLDWLARWRNFFRREDFAKLAQRPQDQEPDFMARAR